jgi:hypothetical protein
VLYQYGVPTSRKDLDERGTVTSEWQLDAADPQAAYVRERQAKDGGR